MSCERIENLEELLKQHIGNHKQIVNTKISQLTEPGDNYGGVLLKVDITLENEENKTRDELNVVVKLIPTNEFLRKLFNIQVTCKKEIAFYDTIVPLLQEFQKEQGISQVIDFVPKLYGARINLNGSETVDDNFAIALENLVQSGYKNVDRRKGFDLETTKLILRDMAALHAVPLAFKISKPEVFEKKIEPYLTPLARPSHPPPKNGATPVLPQTIILEFLEDYEECQSLMPILQKCLMSKIEEKSEDLKGPFLTIIHADMWVNNIMIKFENGKPVGNKFIDFQSFTYGSPATDLFFFLWSSVQNSVLDQSLDDLIHFYHDSFIEHLQQLNCDITPFTFDILLNDIKLACKYRLDQALFMMTFVILGKKGGMTIEAGSSKPPDFGTKDDITPEAKEKVLQMIKEIKKRGWLE